MNNSDLEITNENLKKIKFCYGFVKRKFARLNYTFDEALQDFRIACFLTGKTSGEIQNLDILNRMFRSCKAMSRKHAYTWYEHELCDEDGNALAYEPIYFETQTEEVERKERLEKAMKLLNNGKAVKYLLMKHLMGFTYKEISDRENVKARSVSDAIKSAEWKVIRGMKNEL